MILLVSFSLTACTEKPEEIKLVCEGTETTHASENGKKRGSESRQITRSFVFSKEDREIKIDYYFEDSKSGSVLNGKKLFKKTWIARVDNGVPIYEENSLSIVSGMTTTNQSFVSVTENEITGKRNSSTSSDRDKDKTGDFRNYIFSINRLTGAWHETTKEGYSLQNAYFVVSAEGTCQKAYRKI